jgi:hypothetical protein
LAKKIITSLTEKKLNIEIKSRPVREFKVRLSEGQLELIKWIFVFAFPLALVLLGIGIFTSRRLS